MPLYTPPAYQAAVPSDHGYKAWNGDPAYSTQQLIGTAGTLWICKIHNKSALTVASVSIYVGVAGASLTNVGFGIWDAAVGGTLRASSVNANGATAAAFQSGSAKIVTFTTPPVMTTDFYVGWWTSGTTQPTYYRNGALNTINVGTFATTLPRFATTSNTGLTTTAPGTLGTITQNSHGIWIGVS